jgi:hypothetical protein
MNTDERKVRDAAARLYEGRDLRAVLDYMSAMYSGLVLASNPEAPTEVQIALLQYNALKEVEAQIEFLATGGR